MPDFAAVLAELDKTIDFITFIVFTMVTLTWLSVCPGCLALPLAVPKRVTSSSRREKCGRAGASLKTREKKTLHIFFRAQRKYTERSHVSLWIALLAIHSLLEKKATFFQRKFLNFWKKSNKSLFQWHNARHIKTTNLRAWSAVARHHGDCWWRYRFLSIFRLLSEFRIPSSFLFCRISENFRFLSLFRISLIFRTLWQLTEFCNNWSKCLGFLNRHGLESNGSIVGTGSEHEAIFEEIVNYFPVAISPGGQTLNTMRCVKVGVSPFCANSCSKICSFRRYLGKVYQDSHFSTKILCKKPDLDFPAWNKTNPC